MFSIRINRKTAFLYFALFFAIYNDIIRIPYSDFTAFRLVQPIALLYAFAVGKKSKFIIAAYAGIMAINFSQYYFFTSTNALGITSDYSEYLSYIYFYFCITTVFCIVTTLYEIDPQNAEKNFISFIRKIGIIEIALVLAHGFIRAHGILLVGNINNHGATVAAIVPFFSINAVRKRKVSDIIVIIFAVLALYVGDCKLCLIGVFIQIAVMMLLLARDVKDGSRNSLKIGYLPILILFVLFGVYIFTSTELGALIFKQLSVATFQFGNKEYLSTTSSLGYRINVIILGFEWLVRSWFLGIGMGNFGKIIRFDIPYLAPKWIEKGYVSPHNTPLELLIEFGPIAIAAYIYIFKRLISALKKKRTDINVIFIAEFISIWVWILNPSRITTVYSIWAIIAFLFISNREN